MYLLFYSLQNMEYFSLICLLHCIDYLPGRVIINDFSVVVLINIYAPALSSDDNYEERVKYKLLFYKVSTPSFCFT